MIRWILILALLMANNACGKILELDIFEKKNNLDFDSGFNLTYSEDQKSFFATVTKKQHLFGFGLLLRDTPIRSNSLIHIKYSLNLPITNFLENETALGLGYLDSKHLRRHSGFFEGQFLAGARNYLKLKIRDNTQLGAGITAVKDVSTKNGGWDNAEWEIYLQNEYSGWLSDFQISSKIYNRDRYFFVRKRELTSFKIGPIFSGNKWKLIPFGGVDLESVDNKPYERMQNYGAILDLNILPKSILQLRAGYSRDTIRELDTQMASMGWKNNKTSLETYALSRNGASWYQEKAVGLKLNIKVGPHRNKEKGATKMFSTDDYREPYKRSEFYNETGYQDDKSLSLEEQANRLNSIRLRNEWSGKNLYYKSVQWACQIPTDVYNSRQGDCDDQALLNAWMDRKNGHQAYLLCYWPRDGWLAHGVEIVQDKETGRWFFDEYGILQEIIVDPNAPLQTVAEEALKQCIAFSALPTNYPKVVYWLDEPQDDPTQSRFIGWSWMNNFQSTAGEKPRIEKGYELFVGQNALWQ